ncbi:MAG: hypothetical protein J5817_08810, partial [Treponema sp.]|nr:hypothetical protein [Treponema sp.]
MKKDIKKLIKDDSLVRYCCSVIFFLVLLLVLNLGFGVVVTKKGVYFERDYLTANFNVIILFVFIVTLIIRIILIVNEDPYEREVLASVKGELEKESFWKKDTGLFLHLYFDMDGSHFEREVFAEYSTSLVNILEKGTTKVLVKDPEAKKIILPELV